MTKIIVVGSNPETNRAYLEFLRSGQDVVFVQGIEELKEAMQETGEILITNKQTLPIILKPIEPIIYSDYADGQQKRRDRRAKQRKNKAKP